jgi:hypothetical protein
MDNRNKNNPKEDALIKEVINDESIIPEDVATENKGDEDIPDPDKTIDDDITDITPPTPEIAPVVTPDSPSISPTPEVETDYKEKYSASSREATALHFKNKKMADTIEEASNLPEPTLEELKKYAREQGTDYDEIDTFSQNILKKTLISERRFEMIRETSIDNKRLDEWADKVDTFANSPEVIAKYPSIQDNEVEFKKYCMKESRRGMDMDDLVASFMFKSQDASTPTPRPVKKESILLTSSGGNNAPAKPTTMTAEELRIIRNRNPRRYEQLVKSGKAGLSLLDEE